MNNIQITDDYKITSDKYQYILKKKRVVQEGENKGKEMWIDKLFFGTMNNMLAYLPEYFARQGDSTTLDHLGEEVERYRKIIKNGS